MLKTFLIGIKDVRLAFRDRAALILMLAAPFVLTLGLGLVTGRFSGNNNSGLSDIPVIIVNLDNDQLGNALVDTFNSKELADLMEPAIGSDPEAARQLIDDDEAAAVVIIPEGFTRSIIPQQGDFNNPDAVREPVKIEVYANPSRPTGAGIVKSIVDEFLSRVNEGSLSGSVSILQLMASGRITPQQAEAAGLAMNQQLQTNAVDNTLAITINSSTADGEEVKFDILAYLAPGMALMFLMYTLTRVAYKCITNIRWQSLWYFLNRRGANVDPHRRIILVVSTEMGRPNWRDRVGIRGGLWRNRLGHVHHRTRTHTRTSRKCWNVHHVDLRHHGRKFHQP